MNYGLLREMDVANGEGIRVSLFVTGCSHHCPGCFNEEFQDPRAGEPFTEKTYEKLKSALAHPMVDGLSLLGGEPMEHWEALTEILRTLKAQGFEKTVWIYSGDLWEDIQNHPGKKALLDECDILVDGLFVLEKKDLRLRFRGSSNQRIIHIEKSAAAGKPVLFQE